MVLCVECRRACYAYSLGRPLGVGYVHASNGGVVSSDWIKDGKYEIEIMGRCALHSDT